MKPLNGIDVLGGAYTVYGDTGLCWSNKRGRFVGSNHGGYTAITHAGKKYLIHRLVANAYLGLDLDSGKQLQVDHINGNRKDNRVCNLRVLDSAEHARITSLGKTRANYSSLPTSEIVRLVELHGWEHARESLGVSSVQVLKRLYKNRTGLDPANLHRVPRVDQTSAIQLRFDFEDSWIESTL